MTSYLEKSHRSRRKQTMVFQVGGRQYTFLFNVLYGRGGDAADSRLWAKLVTSVLEDSNLAPGYYADRDAIPGGSILEEGIRIIDQSRFTICLFCADYMDEHLPDTLQQIGILNGTKFLLLSCGVSHGSLMKKFPYFMHYEILHVEKPFSKNIDNWQGKIHDAIKADLNELYSVTPKETHPLELPWPTPPTELRDIVTFPVAPEQPSAARESQHPSKDHSFGPDLDGGLSNVGLNGYFHKSDGTSPNNNSRNQSIDSLERENINKYFPSNILTSYDACFMDPTFSEYKLHLSHPPLYHLS